METLPGTSASGMDSAGPTTRLSQQVGSLAPPGPARSSKIVKQDHTILKPPITTSITGMKQAIFALENGTPEIRDYLVHECNIIYECKSCMSLFRSLANFVSHKRTFCRIRYRDRRHVPRFDGDFSEDNPSAEATVVVATEEPVDTIVPSDFDLMDYCPSVELMKDLGIIKEIQNKPLASHLKTEPKKSLEKVVQGLKAKVDSSFDSEYYKAKELRLESMRYTARGVFQTSMADRYMDLERAKNLKKISFIDPFSQELQPGPPSNSFREKLYENTPSLDSRHVRFPCPKCEKSFGKLATTVSHLIRVHKFSEEKAKRERLKIREKKFSTFRKPTCALPDLTNSLLEELVRNPGVVRLQRLTENVILNWTRQKYDVANMIRSVCSNSVKVECPRLTMSDIFINTSPKERAPIVPSLTLKSHGLSNGDGKSRTKPKRATSPETEVIDLIHSESSDVSMSECGSTDTNQNTESKERVNNDVTQMNEEEEDEEVILTLPKVSQPEIIDLVPENFQVSHLVPVKETPNHDGQKKEHRFRLHTPNKTSGSPTASESSSASNPIDATSVTSSTQDEGKSANSSPMSSQAPSEISSSTIKASGDVILESKSRRKPDRTRITKIVPLTNSPDVEFKTVVISPNDSATNDISTNTFLASDCSTDNVPSTDVMSGGDSSTNSSWTKSESQPVEVSPKDISKDDSQTATEDSKSEDLKSKKTNADFSKNARKSSAKKRSVSTKVDISKVDRGSRLESTKSNKSKLDNSESDKNSELKLDTSNLEISKLDTAKNEDSRSDTSKSDSSKSDTSKSDSSKSDNSKSDNSDSALVNGQDKFSPSKNKKSQKIDRKRKRFISDDREDDVTSVLESKLSPTQKNLASKSNEPNENGSSQSRNSTRSQASSISNVEFGAESIVDLPFPRKEQPKTRKRSRV